MNVLLIDGSGRPGSYNRALLEAFARQLQALKSCELQRLSVSAPALPLLLLDGQAQSVSTAQTDMARKAALGADAFVIASPEYNGGPTGPLKNLIDWMTRPCDAHPKGNPFEGKPLVLLSASPGALGGIKGLQVMRLIMGHLRALVLPEQVALPHAADAFAPDGDLHPGLPADLTKAAAAQLAGFL